MKASSGMFTVLLILWMGGSTWWYVCKIKHHCDGLNTSQIIGTDNNSTTVTDQDQIDQMNEKTKEDIIKDVEKKISIGYIVYNFPSNSTKRDMSEESFRDFAGELKLYLDKYPDVKVQITGHTDDIGSSESNLYFGKKRAEYIKYKLTESGLDAGRMEIATKGESEPLFPNDSEENREKNRRVVIQSIHK
jgi:outer membrane protein OmpA-like peptidoglycan-associated protein